MYDIAIVTTRLLWKHGVSLFHFLSPHPDINVELYTPEQWLKNKINESNSTYTIFIGKNQASAPYIELINKNLTDMNTTYGYNDKIAMIYLTGIERKIHKLREKAIHVNKKVNPNIINAIVLIIGSIIFLPLLIIIYLVRTVNERINLQYKYGIRLFLEKCFAKFIHGEDYVIP